MFWRTLLHDDPVPWLLERRDPAVRALTLRTILERSPRDAELREAQSRAMTAPPISTILRREPPAGRVPKREMYAPKFLAPHWSNLLLAEYGVDGSDPQVRRAARRVLEELSDPSVMAWARDRDHGVSCFWGNVVRYVSLAGLGTDARLDPIVQRLVREARKYDASCHINGEQPCAWGYARLIWGWPRCRRPRGRVRSSGRCAAVSSSS